MSQVTGGKFAVGAATGAMGYLFNQASHAIKDNVQEESWKFKAALIGEGNEITFKAGREIMIEGADSASSLHVNNMYYEGTYSVVGSDYNISNVYKGVLSTAVAGAFSTTRIFSLGAPGSKDKFYWSFKINRVEKSCDNCGSPMINFYERADE